MTTTTTFAETIAFAGALGHLDGLTPAQEDAVIGHMMEQFGDPFDDDGEEIPGLLDAERELVAEVRRLQEEAAEFICAIVRAGGARPVNETGLSYAVILRSAAQAVLSPPANRMQFDGFRP